MILIIQLILYKRDELTAASYSSFNTKSTIASSFKKYETAVSAIAVILKYTKIYVGKWMSAVIF